MSAEEITPDVYFAFARRKTERALAAAFPPYRTVLDRVAQVPALIPLGNAFTRAVFDGPFYVSTADAAERPSLSLAFVQSKDGNTAAPNPAALGGGAVDLHIVYEGLSRVAADGVLAGAGTLGESGMVLSVWHPELVALRAELGLPRHPAQIVVSDLRLTLERELFANVPGLRVFVVTTSRGLERMRASLAARPWIAAIVLDDETGMAGALRTLAREHGITRISCIGGARTATSLVDADAVDDLYLTTAAKPGGLPNTPFYIGARPPVLDLVLRKEGTGPETGVVFEHFRIARRSLPRSDRPPANR